jgi:hypothetical protein
VTSEAKKSKDDDTIMRHGVAVKIEDLPRFERETKTELEQEPDGSVSARIVPPPYPFAKPEC